MRSDRKRRIRRRGAAVAGWLLALGFALAAPAAAGAAQVELAWDPNAEPDLAGYRIHYGTASGVYTVVLEAGLATSLVVTGLADGTTYYLVATAVDALGAESGFSNEVVFTPAAPALAEVLSDGGVLIADGDATPSSADGTDFGRVRLVGASAVRTFTLRNAGSGPLTLAGSPRVAVAGPAAADFTVTVQPSSPVPPGGSATFTVRFDPGAAGTRGATLSIASDDASRSPYDFAVSGVGVPPPGPPRNVRIAS